MTWSRWTVAYDPDTDRPIEMFDPVGWCSGHRGDPGDLCGGCDGCLLIQATHSGMRCISYLTKQMAEACFAVDAIYYGKDEE